MGRQARSYGRHVARAGTSSWQAQPGLGSRGRHGRGPGARPGFGAQHQLAQSPLGLLTLLVGQVLDQEHPVEVVELVLEQSGHQLVGLDIDLVSVQVPSPEVDLLGPDYLPGQAGHRKAALLVDPLTAGLDQLGVDDHLGSFADVVDEEPLAHPDLGGGQAQTGGLVHRVEHGLDQARQITVDVGNLAGPLLEHRVADDPDVEGAHRDQGSGAGSVAAMPGHYFDAQPEARSRPTTVTLTLPDMTVPLTTDRGVFAADGVDPATRYLLAEGPTPPQTGDLLDLGCGYGPIAVALARRSPRARVWAVDVNERARSLCAANTRALGLGNVVVTAPEEVPAEVRFSAIWSNPPVRVGKAALHEILARWLGRMAPGASALLVVSRHLGADSLAGWLAGEGWEVDRLGSRRGVRLLEVRASDPEGPVAGP